MRSLRTVFVTVGTTSFDELIKTVLSEEILQVLKEKGFDKVVLQIGRGNLEGEVKNTVGNGDLPAVEWYRYKDSIKDDLTSASLVMSHAGAGSVLETLKLQKPLIIVINENLMNNHQVELAHQLYKDGHLLYCTCRNLKDTVQTFNAAVLKPFELGRPQKFAAFLDSIVGLN